MNSHVRSVCALLAALSCGCIEDEVIPVDAAPRDVTADTLPDRALPDVAPDLPRDAAADVPMDTPQDLAPDLAVDAPADAGCADGTSLCGAQCVDTRTDMNHCGACGRCCPGTCTDGVCAVSCGTGRSVCYATPGVCSTARCVDLSTDSANCGGCGTACPAGRACVAGSCSACACAAGRSCCGTTCADLSADPENCGTCGTRCCPGNLCSRGVCQLPCPVGQTACPGPLSSCRGSVCIDTQFDRTNCGACGTICPAGQFCLRGACAAP